MTESKRLALLEEQFAKLLELVDAQSTFNEEALKTGFQVVALSCAFLALVRFLSEREPTCGEAILHELSYFDDHPEHPPELKCAIEKLREDLLTVLEKTDHA